MNILKSKAYKIGSTTGYTQEIMDVLIPLVKKQGFIPESIVNASQTSKARPHPHMLLKFLMDLDVLNLKGHSLTNCLI